MVEKVSRRTLAKGAAWATPAVTLASITPAMAASCPAGIAETINAHFTQHLDTIKRSVDPEKIHLRV